MFSFTYQVPTLEKETVAILELINLNFWLEIIFSFSQIILRIIVYTWAPFKPHWV